jgi:hypothetical protein
LSHWPPKKRKKKKEKKEEKQTNRSEKTVFFCFVSIINLASPLPGWLMFSQMFVCSAKSKLFKTRVIVLST